MPVGIAYIASYLMSQVDSHNIEIRLYDRPDVILKDIEQWRPDVVGLSNYCWNAELSRFVFDYAKQLNPETVCVAGGPEFPVEQTECKEYLLYRKEIDFYVYLEDEVVFSDLIKRLRQGTEVLELGSGYNFGLIY
jgi:hypothetical protein